MKRREAIASMAGAVVGVLMPDGKVVSGAVEKGADAAPFYVMRIAIPFEELTTEYHAAVQDWWRDFFGGEPPAPLIVTTQEIDLNAGPMCEHTEVLGDYRATFRAPTPEGVARLIEMANERRMELERRARDDALMFSAQHTLRRQRESG